MADLATVYDAMRNAHAAGDTAAAQKLAAYIEAQSAQLPKQESAPAQQEPGGLAGLNRRLGQSIANAGAGALRGAGSIGASILSPLDALGLTGMTNDQRRAAMDYGLKELGADPESLAYQGGKLGGEIAGTAGIGGALAKGVGLASQSPKALALAEALRTGGMSAGGAGMGARVAGGALSGGAMAGAVNPEDAMAGALLGGSLPGVVKGAGVLGSKISGSMKASPEIAQLAKRADELGIDVPADRIANSRLLNATAESLNYLPFSGRTATEAKMNSQIRTALSKTFGENTDNLSKDVLSSAQQKLGQGFDDFLTNNNVKVDQQLWSDLQANLAKAKNELSADNYRIIENQVKDLWGKIDNGVIDGQAAYNVKKTLDRLGRGNGNEAFHAKEVRNSIMGSVLRSAKPEDAAAFTELKRQYANLKSLQKLAGNTAEGEISMARLGNIDSKNPEVQDLARIAATFAKTRENPHGAMQRVAMGAMGGGALAGSAMLGMAAPVAAGLTGGRLANMALNSPGLKNMLIGQPSSEMLMAEALANPTARSAGLLSLQSR